MKIFFVSLLFVLTVNAQTAHFDSTVIRGIKQIYNIQFDEAETTFRGLIADYPNHPAGRFMLAMIDWWKILLDFDNTSRDEAFLRKIEDVIYQCEQLLDKNENDVDALFFKGGAIGYRGRLRAYRESWIKAADDGKEALPIVERAARINPDNMDVQLGFGIYNYYASVIPEHYPMIKPLMIFFPKGDKAKGIQQLTNTAYNGKYSKYEAQYFLVQLYSSFENNPWKAKEFSELLTKEFPNNPIFQRYHGRIFAKLGDYHNSSLVFKDFIDKANKKLYGYNSSVPLREGNYYIGVYYKNTQQNDSALFYFKKCEELSKRIDKEESGFYANSVLYQGMINDLIGKREEAVKFYNRVLEIKEYAGSHGKAEEYLKNPYK